MDLFINVSTGIVLGLVGLVFLNEMRLTNKKEVQDKKYRSEAHRRTAESNEIYLKLRNQDEKNN